MLICFSHGFDDDIFNFLSITMDISTEMEKEYSPSSFHTCYRHHYNAVDAFSCYKAY